jgi:putative ABC transport system ATP-binding protein
MVELRVEQVFYHYKNGDRDVLNNVSCDFNSGEVTAIVGPSGSGKTTLLSILAGLDKPKKGKVFIGEDNLNDLDLDQYRRERISMIFQAFHLFPLLTALENVCYPMEMNGVSRKEAETRAKELLEMVHVTEDKHKRYPSNLSGGEQQRVAIARALSTGARILLADEPTGNLDVANGEVVLDLLKNLAHDGKYCVIIVTHNMEIAEASDVVYRMRDGVLSMIRNSKGVK